MRNDILVRLRLAGEEFSREFDRKFDEAIKNAEGKSEASGRRSGGGFARGFLGAAGIGAIGAAIGAAINESAELGLEISKTSRQFNIGAEDLQVWRFAAQQAGVTASEFDDSLNDLAQRIGEANAGNRDAQQSFVDLGVSFETTSGQARGTNEVLLDLAARISDIEDPSERVRLGTELMGEQFEFLHPLLLDGADGFSAAADELDRFGGVLSREEIQNLEQTNAKIEQMKTVLSIKIAGIVAENSDAIIELTTSLAELAAQSINTANAWLTFRNAQMGRSQAVAALPDNLSDDEREARIAEIDARAGRREVVTSSHLGGLVKFKEVEFRPDGNFDDVSLFTDANRASLEAILRPSAPPTNAGIAAPPRLSAPSARTGARSQRQSAEQREAQRAAEQAVRAEEQLRNSIERTITAQEDSAEVERIRATEGDIAAAAAEAELSFLRQHPLAVHETVEALAAALGITKQLTEADKERLQLLINQGDAAQATAGDEAASAARERADREAQRQEDRAEKLAERQAEQFRRAHESAVLDVADLYETAMRRGVDGIWESFEDEGLRIIAEIAAQWTLAMIAGNPFDLSAAAGAAASRSPLSSIFFGSGIGGAANDNGIAGIFGGGTSASVSPKINPSIAAKQAKIAAQPQGVGVDGLGEIGLAFALSQAGIAIGGNDSLLGQAGGLAGSLGGQALGSSLSALGSFGGPIGAVAGGLIGNLLGGILGGSKRGSATIGGFGDSLSVTGVRGNSSREAGANQLAGSVISTLESIADRLGGTLNPGVGRVSIGTRGDDFRVDPTGRGRTRQSNGAINFGSDEAAAIEFALRDLISDGVLTGLSQVTQNLINRPNSDIEEQIEKALLVEQVPDLLRQRLDPLGAALDEVYDRFKTLADVLQEGGANAEQLAEAQRLYELEKAEAISSIGLASQTLQDYLSSLNAGSNSPLSLRQQRIEAEAQLAPFLEQISEAEAARAEVERLRSNGAGEEQIASAEAAARTAAAAIDQSGLVAADQLLLSISRQTNASGAEFFSDFDRSRALIGQAIGFVDAATPAANDNRDPFAPLIAKHTEDAAYILSDNTVILREIRDNLAALQTAPGIGSSFIGQARAFSLR